METSSAVKYPSSMRTQVARSKGTEWMVSSYNAWQQRSPLPKIPKSPPPYSLMRLVSRLDIEEKQLDRGIALSFRSILLILGLIITFKSR
ncbi:MAG: hypothetical protein WC780_18845 [Lentimicrobiaceae bacterium]